MRAKVTRESPVNQPVVLESLRGIAILRVVMGHVATSWTAAGFVPPALPFFGASALSPLVFGPSGVVLFFLLSGYLLSATEGRRAKEGSYNVRGYVLRRALRLAPAYYLLAIPVVVLAWPTNPSAWDVVAHVSFFHTLSPSAEGSLDPNFWSLTPEVAFYCLLPLIVLKVPGTRGRLILFGILALVSLATRWYMDANAQALASVDPAAVNLTFLYHLPSTHLYLFVAGMLLRTLLTKIEAKFSSGFRSKLAWGLLLLFALFVLSIPYVAFPYLGVLPQTTVSGPEGLIVDLSAAAFFLAAMLGCAPLSRVLSWRPLRFVGMVSYSMFLLHASVVLLLSGFLPDSPHEAFASGPWAWIGFSFYAALVLVISTLVAWLGYRFVERPFLGMKPK